MVSRTAFIRFLQRTFDLYVVAIRVSGTVNCIYQVLHTPSIGRRHVDPREAQNGFSSLVCATATYENNYVS